MLDVVGGTPACIPGPVGTCERWLPRIPQGSTGPPVRMKAHPFLDGGARPNPARGQNDFGIGEVGVLARNLVRALARHTENLCDLCHTQ